MLVIGAMPGIDMPGIDPMLGIPMSGIGAMLVIGGMLVMGGMLVIGDGEDMLMFSIAGVVLSALAFVNSLIPVTMSRYAHTRTRTPPAIHAAATR